MFKDGDIIVTEDGYLFEVYYIEKESSYGGIYRYDCTDSSFTFQRSYSESRLKRANFLQRLKFRLCRCIGF